MSLVYRIKDQYSLWLWQITDIGNMELSYSRCTIDSAYAGGSIATNMMAILSGDRYFAWKNSVGTMLMAVAYGTFYSYLIPKYTCPTLLVRGALGGDCSIDLLNQMWDNSGVYMWRDSAGDPLAVLINSGTLYLRGTLVYQYYWAEIPTSYYSSETCKSS